MNAYQKSNELGLTGTDAEIVAVLRTLSRDNIPAASVRTWLRQDRDPVLLAYDGSAWYGTLEDMLKANQLPAEMVAGLRELKALMLEGGVLRTTQPGPAVRVYRIVAGIAEIIGGDPLATIGSFFGLDGGQPFRDLTVEAYAAQKADAARLAEAEQWLASVFNEIINPAASDPARTLSSVKAAVALAAVTP
jgi:hypothetical protein